MQVVVAAQLKVVRHTERLRLELRLGEHALLEREVAAVVLLLFKMMGLHVRV